MVRLKYCIVSLRELCIQKDNLNELKHWCKEGCTKITSE